MADRGDREEDRWPEGGFGDRGGAGRRRLSDYEGGYGGGRDRAEQWPEHGFGDRGWGGGRGHGSGQDQHSDRRHRDLPEGTRPARGGGEWQERYVRENSDKYGQGGGYPVSQRGPGDSAGGYPDRDSGPGDTRDVSARGGGYGPREAERWGNRPRGNFAGRGPKNYVRSDERISDDIHHRLTDHPEIDASEIEVLVKDGNVTLSGTVDDRQARWGAEDAAGEVTGVRDVTNNIRVQRK